MTRDDEVMSVIRVSSDEGIESWGVALMDPRVEYQAFPLEDSEKLQEP